MIFSVAEIVSYVSHYMTLKPGDLIATGTPAGVGLGMKPVPVWLKAGDRIRIHIEKLGYQNPLVTEQTPIRQYGRCPRPIYSFTLTSSTTGPGATLIPAASVRRTLN